MVLDLGILTRRGLLVDRMHPADSWWGGTKHRECRGRKSRNEAEEDRGTTDLSAMANDRPIDSTSSQEIPMILKAVVSTASS